ncbi:MAG: flagellar biosynthetic protein FliO [bacterium]
MILLSALLPQSALAAGTVALPSVGLSLVRVGASLALVIALLLALAAMFRRVRAVSRAAHPGPRLETIDRLDVGARRELRLVRAGDRLLVVGITEQRIELLSELDAPAEETATAPGTAQALLRTLAISS